MAKILTEKQKGKVKAKFEEILMAIGECSGAVSVTRPFTHGTFVSDLALTPSLLLGQSALFYGYSKERTGWAKSTSSLYSSSA